MNLPHTTREAARRIARKRLRRLYIWWDPHMQSWQASHDDEFVWLDGHEYWTANSNGRVVGPIPTWVIYGEHNNDDLERGMAHL